MATQEMAKKARSVAKGKFTRINNRLAKAITEDDDMEYINETFDDLREAWDDVQAKHEVYVQLLPEEQDDEAWILELDKVFSATQKFRISHRKDKMKVAADAELETTELARRLEQEEADRRALEEMQHAVEQADRFRHLEKASFRQEADDLRDLLADESPGRVTVGGIKLAQKDFEMQFEKCKAAQNKFVGLLDKDTAIGEIDWIKPIQRIYRQVNMEIGVFLENHGEENSYAKPKTSGLRLERMKMPRFEGGIRDYPRFKDDFLKQVMPEMQTSKSAAYALRSCLGKSELTIVKSVGDDLANMWESLDEEYGDPGMVADAIINEIKRFKPIRDGDHKKFIEFVGVVEEGYRDLGRLSMEREITTTSSVSIIERRLPPNVRERWSELVCRKNTDVDKTNKFPHLLQFLLEKKRAIKYDFADLRGSRTTNKATVNLATQEESVKHEEKHHVSNKKNQNKCWLHQTDNHKITECRAYVAMPSEARVNLLKENRACWSCLGLGHRSSSCKRRQVCGEDGCSKHHHKSLHAADVAGVSFHSLVLSSGVSSDSTCLLQLMKIKTGLGWVNTMWDCGATMSFITLKKAKKEKLKGVPVELSLVKVGGETEKIKSYKYELPLIDKKDETVYFEVYGIERITADIQTVNLDGVIHLFKHIRKNEVHRPTGQVDVLIGYEYAGYHPVKEQAVDHLLLLSNRFGKCLGGSHPDLNETTKRLVQNAVLIHHVAGIKVEDFYRIEAMGVECTPKCGGCRCGHCPAGGKDYTLKEEHELKIIENNLSYKEDHWEAQYPWIRDPVNLPDNRTAAMRMLQVTEKRLTKNKEHAKVYMAQIDDMVERGVARKLTEDEQKTYNGPVHYISHHEVLKPDSKSTPCRIVFNSSANFQGHVLNDYWAKGPDLLNNLLGVLIRFREEKVAITGDIKKMYHAVKISLLDQHTHRFLWRDMEMDRKPDTYAILSVSFGDRPAGTIATVALRKTAEMGKDIHPAAAEIILKNTYMDDVLDSVSSKDKAKCTTTNIEELIEKGGFKIKGWVISGEPSEADTPEQLTMGGEKVLGAGWDPKRDCFYFRVKLNFSPKKRKTRTGPDLEIEQIPTGVPLALTKRMILSQVNGIYDPMGLASPFTVKAKIQMRRLWASELKIGWDDPIPEELRQEWVQFFRELFEMEQIVFTRCLKPDDAIADPILIMFSDGSNDAYGTCAYVRWELTGGGFACRLIASKNRLAPLRRITIVRIELCGAVLSKRLRMFIEKETRYNFAAHYHIVDSEIVRAMIQKESYGFNTFTATRIGEIQETTEPTSWYWVEGPLNIADWITRGRSPSEIGTDSSWQQGPDFLQLPVTEWPIKRSCSVKELPERNKVVLTAEVQETDSLAARIDITRHSRYAKLIRVTARVLAMYQRKPTPSLKNATLTLNKEDLETAEVFWIRDAQNLIRQDVEGGKYRRLCPKIREDKIIVVGGRAERWLEMSYNNKEVILLPYKHHFSRLYAEHVHNQGHLGTAATTSKIRTRFWIVNLHRLTRSIKYNCLICKKLEKELAGQMMGKLPEERLKPAPAWYYTGVDLFGPFTTRGEVQKRVRGKAYGVLFNCMGTRAVHVDVADNYSTDGFMRVLRRFISLRGCPSKLHSDGGSQLVAASRELNTIAEAWDWDKLRDFGAEKGMEWDFTPGDAPWQNGCSEALIKSVKKAITVAVGDQVMTPAELQTVCFEAANLVNERPIGRHPQNPDDGAYLCPNDLLLGRATSRVPSGPFMKTTNPTHRHEFVQKIVDAFWKKWTRDFFPSLLIRQRWHTERRNLVKGDIVLVQDSNQVRGNWRLGRVSQVFPGQDSKVRKVEVQYKNPKPGEPVDKYSGRDYVTVERAVQRLVVILPAADDKASDGEVTPQDNKA